MQIITLVKIHSMGDEICCNKSIVYHVIQFFLNTFYFILFQRQGDSEFHSSVSSPDAQNGHGLARTKLGAWNSIQVAMWMAGTQ